MLHTRHAALLGLATLAALGLAAATPQQAHAQTPGYSIVTQGDERSVADGRAYVGGTVGAAFTVGPADVTVADLGFFVDEEGVLNDPHQVAIYTTGGTLVGTVATVPAGTQYTPDAFAYVPVTPFTLSANTPYVIGASLFNNTDPFLDVDNPYPTGTSTLPGAGIASVGAGRFSSGTTSDGSVLYPDNSNGSGTEVYAGPNFELAAAPEPSQFAGLGLGALSLAGLALKARKRSA